MSVSLSANSLIASSLRLIGALSAGETADANDASDAFAVLNQLIDSWETQHLTKPTVARFVDDLIANQASYTIGPSGDLDHPRPTDIDAAAWLDPSLSPDAEYPLSKLTEQQWQAITNKAQTGTQPTAFYYDPTDPDGTIYLWPVPDNASYDLVLYVKAAFAQYEFRDVQVTLPPGYARALRFNLALDLIPEFGKGPDIDVQEIRRIASDALSALKQQNVTMSDLVLDPAYTGGGAAYDITTDS